MSRERAKEYLRQPYARVIIPDEEGLYSGQVLEFPGCFSSGESAVEAYENLEEAACDWVEAALEQGLDIPPALATHRHSGTVSLRIPRSLHQRAADYARQEGVSLNQFLLDAIAERVGAESFAARLIERTRASVGQVTQQAGPTPVFYFQGMAVAAQPVAGTAPVGSEQLQDPYLFTGAPSLEGAARRHVHTARPADGSPFLGDIPSREGKELTEHGKA